MQELRPQPALGAALSALPACLLDDPIGIAVSGGSDSLALFILAHHWASGLGRTLVAFTVDHGLRPEAREEAEAVGRLCNGLGIDHQILRLEGAPPRQSALRRLRHGALARALRQKSGKLLLIGHTADDQVETFLMRARQGSGWYGLAGMRPLSLSPVWPEGEGVFIARPLMGVRRDALRDFLRSQGTGWAEDPLFRGAYSHAVPGAQSARTILATPLANGRLRFAGEACHPRFAATVAGAWLSGLEAARGIP